MSDFAGPHEKESVLLYGASGSIGQEIFKALKRKKYDIWRCSKFLKTDLDSKLFAASEATKIMPGKVSQLTAFKHIIFAQGVNTNDSAWTFNHEEFHVVFEANVMTILRAVSQLVQNEMLASDGSITIVSSIWQEKSRANKMSYTVTKSALKGVVLSLVADLSKIGVRVNAVLPGPINNEMTRANLTDEQMLELTKKTPMGRLVKIEEVANAVLFLISSQASGLTGNFLTLDLGFSDVEVFEN